MNVGGRETGSKYVQRQEVHSWLFSVSRGDLELVLWARLSLYAIHLVGGPYCMWSVLVRAHGWVC